MSQAALFGLVTSGALVAGAFTGMRWMPPVHFLASLLAFAAGALTAAMAFELFEESVTQGGHVLSAVGFAAGATGHQGDHTEVLIRGPLKGAGGSLAAFALFLVMIQQGAGYEVGITLRSLFEQIVLLGGGLLCEACRYDGAQDHQ